MNLLEHNSSSTDTYKNNYNYTNKLPKSQSLSSYALLNEKNNFKVNSDEKEEHLCVVDAPNSSIVKEFSASGSTNENYEKKNILERTEIYSKDNKRLVDQDEVETNVKLKNEDREALVQQVEKNDNVKEISKSNDKAFLNKKIKTTMDTSHNSSIKLVKESSLKLKKKKPKISSRKSNSSSSTSIATFIRNFFSCGVSCYSCSGLRRRDHKKNSIKSHSSNETMLGAITAGPTIKSTQNSFKKIDQVIQYSSTESIINKFDDLKKKKTSIPATVETNRVSPNFVSDINCNSINEKTSNNLKSGFFGSGKNVDGLTQLKAFSSIKRKPKIKKQCSIIDENYNLNNDLNNCSNANDNLLTSKLILPILKINDTEIKDVDAVSLFLDKNAPTQEESKKNVEFLSGIKLLL